MNSDLMNIIETQANDDDLLSSRARSLEDKKGNNNNGTPNYNFGLSLGRSQSAAPQWNFSSNNNNPTSSKSAVNDSSIGGTNNERDIFGSGSRFFSEGAGTNEEGGGDQDDIIRRPASTGVIGRPTNEAEDGDVNSILETLGLASLGTSTAANNGQPSPYSTKSLGMGSHNTPKKSLMEKINEGNNKAQDGGDDNNNYGTGSSSSYFTNDKDPGSNALFQGKHEINQAAPTQIQYVQAPPQAAQVQQRQEQHSHYNPQQQIYYQQAPYQTQDYRGQQVYVVPQQQNVYLNQAPQAQYGGYDQQYPQQQQHIIMHQPQMAANGAPMHGQPQYISVAAPPPHIIQGAQGQQQYAYIQYAQPATTYVMGPNGPIPVSNPPMMNYSGHHGSSPPGGTGRSPPRSSMRTPDRQRGRNNTPTSRGKQRDRSGSTPSKLGPEAANLLEQIRAAKSRNQWTIHDIQGHVVEFCLDQNGSRFIQQRLEVAEADEKDSVMDEIIPAIKDLNNDVFGNYVIQKCYEFGTEKMKNDLKGTLKGNMMLLSLQMYGCRVVQKALESLKFDDICDLLSEFDSYVLTCIQDQNGNHVMQKCIEVMSRKAKDAEARSGEVGLSDSMAEKIQFIVDDVHANVRSLCCHPYGCRVLQRMLEHCVDFQKGSTLDQIQLVHKALMDDQYGNYVIQHVLQYGRDSDRDSLLNIIVEGNLLKLSRQKFASNVVEKLLKYGNSKQRNAIVREMLIVVNEGGQEDGEGSTVLLLMVRDAYANYVVQTALDVVPEGHEKRLLLDELRANEAQLRNYTFAKHIVAKITK